MATASSSTGAAGAASLADAAEPLSFDETVKAAFAFCESLPPDFAPCLRLLAELQTRLSKGRLHFAILGQFNRGKSTFINALLRIKALPTSVLPLTSVPTLIEHGAEARCRVRFLDGRADLTVGGAPDGAAGEIEDALRQYVAEGSNPKNRLGVRDATLSCASDLLANGTVLIDTPGFGSTHLHNTRTTLDLLPECDAALFLLSADPPMTQTEMEFLRQVKERIPKIYFILNKVDLLSAPELDEVEGFIRNILCNELGFPVGTAIYRTCAAQGERAKPGKEGDKAWEQSGLDAVRKEALDFMMREKYFTLSEALSGKYSEIMAGIKARLEKNLSDITAPIAAAQKEANDIAGAIQTLNLELEAQTKKCAEEKKALAERLDTLAKESGERCAALIKKTLHAMLDGKYFPDEAASIASVMLPKTAADIGMKLLDAMVESANKSIRPLALRHAMSVTNLQKRHAGLLKGGGIAERNAENFIETTAIPTAKQTSLFNAAPWETPQPHIADIFKNRAARLDAIRAFYEPRCADCAATSVNQAAKQARLLCEAAWGKLQGEIRASYQEMIDCLKPALRAKQERLRQAQEGAKGDIAFFKGKIRELLAL